MFLISFSFIRARQAKDPIKGSAEVKAQSTTQPLPETAASTPGPTDVCRVQVRLPNGRVIRQSFSCSASLNDVATFVMEKDPQFSTMILVQVQVSCKYVCVSVMSSLSLSLSLQPFPHHEFTSEECQKSLHALRLYPSTSLVVSKQSVGRASAAMETDPSHSTGSTTFPAPRSSRKVSFGREQIMAASSHTNRTAQGTCYMYM